jgi:hypothetical protein
MWNELDQIIVSVGIAASKPDVFDDPDIRNLTFSLYLFIDLFKLLLIFDFFYLIRNEKIDRFLLLLLLLLLLLDMFFCWQHLSKWCCWQ